MITNSEVQQSSMAKWLATVDNPEHWTRPIRTAADGKVDLSDDEVDDGDDGDDDGGIHSSPRLLVCIIVAYLQS
jgi:hypothetical protein